MARPVEVLDAEPKPPASTTSTYRLGPLLETQVASIGVVCHLQSRPQVVLFNAVDDHVLTLTKVPQACPVAQAPPKQTKRRSCATPFFTTPRVPQSIGVVVMHVKILGPQSELHLMVELGQLRAPKPLDMGLEDPKDDLLALVVGVKFEARMSSAF